MILFRVLFLLLGLLTESLWASAVQITPIRIFFHPTHSIETLKITNQDKEPVLIQLDVKKWQQDENGKDVYESTSDLMVMPALFTVQGEQSQIVRLAVLKPEKNPPPIEKSYRLVLREVPQPRKDNEGVQQLNMALEMLLPIFVSSQKTKNEMPHIYTGTVLPSSNPHAAVKIDNSGNNHFLVTGLTIFDSENRAIYQKEKLFSYLLPGKSKIIYLETDKIIPQDARIVLKTNS